MTAPRYFGLDIGGTKIELVACTADLQVIHRSRVATPQQDYPAFIAAVADLVAAAEQAIGARASAVGVGVPGVVDRVSGQQLSANVPALSGQRVGHDLQARLQRPLQLGNDLHCFALSEAHGGAGAGYPSMFGAILGTGAGGGFCIDGRLIAGCNGIAGEWGHWSVAATLLQRYALPLLDCACGLRGCLERYVSGSGLAMIHRQLGGADVDASAITALADAADGNAQANAMQTGNDIARRALAIHRDLLGHALASLVMALDPHVIVLGGGLSKDPSLYRQLPIAVATHLFKGMQVPPILPPAFGDAGGARGAALLARQHHPSTT